MKTLSKLLVALFLLMAFPQTGEASFTANKQYNNQTTGSNINTWGIVLNSNFTTIDNNLGGTLTLSVAGNSNVTLTVTQAQNLIYDLTGTLTGNITVFFPAQGGFYYVNNQTSGAYTITVESTGDSSGILVPQGGGLPIIVDNSTSPPTTFSPNYALAGANSNITSLTGLTTPLSHAQGGSAIYAGGTSGGSANAQTLATVVPANFTLAAGNIVTGIAGYTNNSAATLAVNSLSATAMRKETPSGLAALTGGEIIVGNSYVWYYDGTYFILMNPSLGASAYLNQAFTTAGTIASATTTDLGSVATNIQTISGTTTITGFGSSASAANPLYFITFSGALTLTDNATSLILPGGANITTAAGDTAIAKYEGSGNWQVLSYSRASGGPVSLTLPNGTIATTQAANDNSTKVATTAYVNSAAAASPNFYQHSPSNPSAVSPGTTSASGKMLGLAGSITPSALGVIYVTIEGALVTSSSANGELQIRYGTGTAPSNNANVTGTAAGNIVFVNTSTTVFPFTCGAIITGLSAGTAYWLDLNSWGDLGSSTQTITNVGITAIGY